MHEDVKGTVEFNALVLAADRAPADAVARAAGVSCKAAARVGGIPMLERVLRALSAARGAGRIHVVGPAEEALTACPSLATALAMPGVTREAPRASPSMSAAAGIATLGVDIPVLLTTADHALLAPPVIDAFTGASLPAQADVSVALVPYALVRREFPGVKRTVLRFRDGEFCTCNLFLIRRGGARVLDFWVHVEQQRKHPLRLVAGVLGLTGMAAYALGLLTLRGALRRAGHRLGARIEPVLLSDATASVDVDTPEDLHRVEQILARGGGN